jgi:hypothetical protein
MFIKRKEEEIMKSLGNGKALLIRVDVHAKR